MPSATSTEVTIWEDGGASLMARVVGPDAVNINQAAITSIAGKVYNEATGVLKTTLTVVVASTVYDTLQTDARWTVDGTGYNFRDDVAASVFADGDTVYRVEYKFTPASGEAFFVIFRAHARNVMSS